MHTTILTITPGSAGINLSGGYIIGAILALVIMGYLIYSLIKPEKF